ncbi:MAG: GntR family transcriptional regulator [Eubacteriales bacterium]
MNANKNNYRTIINDIKKMIDNGEIKPGDKISSEPQLCDKYDLCRTTVRKAIAHLSHEGYIYTISGKGNFVNDLDLNNFKVSYYNPILNNFETKLINADVIYPTDKIKIAMQLYDNKKIVVLKNKKLCDNKVIGYSLRYFPYNASEPILENVFHFTNKSFIDKTVKKTINIRVIKAYEPLSDILSILVGYPLLVIEKKSRAANEQIIEYETTYYIGNKYKVYGF